MTGGPDCGPPRLVSRRQLLASGGVAGIGAAAGVSRTLGGHKVSAPSLLNGLQTVPFWGRHQPGIEMTPQAVQNLIALNLRSEVGADDLRRLLGILTDDASRMMSGTFALADSEPELALTPARLTVTIGFGAEIIRRVRGSSAVPPWLGPLPSFSIDQLDDAWCGGDLLLQVATDDPITLAHSTRMLLKDCRSFAMVAWWQHGFRNAPGSLPNGTTMRNLMGQVDGTSNPEPGTDEFDRLVWRNDDWLNGGTTMVVRRIAMLLDKWDRLDRAGREAAVGRRLSDGAPLTGVREHDRPDFEARTPIGFPLIAEFAHIRRARPGPDSEQVFRRGYNYELGPGPAGISDAGLIFTSFQADLEKQFLPIQRRLAELDLLNEWTVPIGSAVFAIPPGIEQGEFIGAQLFG